MNLAEIGKIRAVNQQIVSTAFATVKEVVGWMGAMQAQDFAMAKWAAGVRLPVSTQADVETAINNAEILRTHILRPTWHFVSADDIYWMLDLTAPQIRAAVKTRFRELDLTEALFAKSNRIIEDALLASKQLSRAELVTELRNGGIATDENRASHILFRAELDKLICSGAINKGMHCYALLEERVPRTKQLNKSESLAKLAKKFFESHGPAMLQDFAWWSGLSAHDAKQALESVKSNLNSEVILGQTFWFSNSLADSSQVSDEIAYLLPAFDEYIISYKDRSAVLLHENQSHAISSNGIFRPVILLNGVVIGLWKRTLKKDKIVVEIVPFEQPDNKTRELIEKAALQFGRFIQLNVDVSNYN
jgi:hypothetical protein